MNWLLIALGAIPTLILSLSMHSLYMDWIVNPRHEHELKDQKKTLTEQCKQDKQITEAASAKYQSELDALNGKLSALKLRKPARCVPVIAHAAPRPDGSTIPAKLFGPYGFSGLSSEWLYDYAGDAERERLKVIGLQEFVKKVWSTR